MPPAGKPGAFFISDDGKGLDAKTLEVMNSPKILMEIKIIRIYQRKKATIKIEMKKITKRRKGIKKIKNLIC